MTAVARQGLGHAPGDPAGPRDRLGEMIEARLGLRFPPERAREYARGLQAAALELGEATLADLADRLEAGDPAVLAALAERLTVGETYFFREKRTLDLFAGDILPLIASARRQAGERTLRLLCAGCCTGEEPYTLAIILRSRLPDADGWRTLIEGEDVNDRFLARARCGEYGPWSFRETPEAIKTRWFLPAEGGRLAVRPELRGLVRFTRRNLVDPVPAGGPVELDAIFCRNVLMYFAPDRVESVLRGLAARLGDGGWFFAGLSETSLVQASGVFEMQWRDGLAVFRKRSPTASRPAPAWPRTPPPPPPSGSDRPGSTPADVSPEPRPAAPGRDLTEARRLIETGRREEAAERLAALIDLPLPAPWLGEALALLAGVLANQGRLDEAARTCRQALDQNRLDVSRHVLLATIEQERGDLAEASAALGRALFLAPEDALGHFTLGLLQARQGLAQAAERSLRRAGRLLRALPPDEPIGGRDGMTAGRLTVVVDSLLAGSAKPAMDGGAGVRVRNPGPFRG